MYGYKKLYIDGKLVDASDRNKRSVICPGTGEEVAQVAWANSRDAGKALEAARRGFETWRAYSLTQRKEWMLKLKSALVAREELLRESVMYENGKTWAATGEDYEILVNSLSHYAEEIPRFRGELIPDPAGTHEHKIVYEPAGVVIAYLAWNFPLLNVGYKLGPALAAGCSIIIKPSSKTPLSAYIVGEIAAQIDFPAGVINVLSGPNSEVSSVLSASPIPAVLTAIGSSRTGRAIIEQSTASIKRFSMELGGNAPAIVFEDADLENAVTTIAALKCGNCGQICVSPNRIFVQDSIYDRFRDMLIEKVSQVKIGFGRDSGADMGPLTEQCDCDRIQELIQEAVAGGASIVYQTEKNHLPERGYFFPMTVIQNVTASMRIFKEEIFGPVATLVRFDTEQEAVAGANDTDAGLASYVFCRDIDRINRVSRALEFGEVQVNGVSYNLFVPHVGIKQSGMGADCSHLALHDYLTVKRISTRLA